MVFFVGLVLLLIGIGFDWADLLPKIGLPVRELSNPWVVADLGTLRTTCVIFATVLIVSAVVL